MLATYVVEPFYMVKVCNLSFTFNLFFDLTLGCLCLIHRRSSQPSRMTSTSLITGSMQSSSFFVVPMLSSPLLHLKQKNEGSAGSSLKAGFWVSLRRNPALNSSNEYSTNSSVLF